MGSRIPSDLSDARQVSVFLDVNIPMYAAGEDHPLRAPCVKCMTLIAEGKLDVVINAEILQEILHRYSRIGLKRKGLLLARNLALLVPAILPVTGEDMELAITLFEQHPQLKSRDVVHLATMRNNGIEEIISTDTHFDAVKFVKRIPPEEL